VVDREGTLDRIARIYVWTRRYQTQNHKTNKTTKKTNHPTRKGDGPSAANTGEKQVGGKGGEDRGVRSLNSAVKGERTQSAGPT